MFTYTKTQTDVRCHPSGIMDNRVAIRKIAKNGNSRTVTVTDEANSLNLLPGEKVVLAIAPLTEENKNIFATFGLIGSSEASVLPTKFIGPESPSFNYE